MFFRVYVLGLQLRQDQRGTAGPMAGRTRTIETSIRWRTRAGKPAIICSIRSVDVLMSMQPFRLAPPQDEHAQFRGEEQRHKRRDRRSQRATGDGDRKRRNAPRLRVVPKCPHARVAVLRLTGLEH